MRLLSGYLPAALALLSLAVIIPLEAEEATTATKPAADLAQTGDLFSPSVECVFAVYLLPGNKTDAAEIMRTLLEKQKLWAQVATPPTIAKKPTIALRPITDVAKTYAPPSIDSLKYFGRDLSKEQAEQVQQSPEVCILVMDYPSTDLWKCLRSANELVGDLAVQTQGLVWDEATRELFSPEGWKKDRTDTWPVEGIPDITKQITIHAYKDGDYVRAITLGMSKIGLPDISVNGFAWSSSPQMGNLIDILAQSLAEGTRLGTPGQLDLDIRNIKQDDVRKREMDSLLAHASSVARLGLKKGVPEQGDDENRQFEIAFDRYEGVDVHARQDALVDGLFGSHDSAKAIKHDDELKALSASERAKLPELRATFNKGLAPGEFIELKEPFDGDNGEREWMWVEVISWKGDAIKGLLKNEPYHVAKLHGGQTVDVLESTAFDYIHRFPDGSEEGNETGKLIEKMDGAVEEK